MVGITDHCPADCVCRAREREALEAIAYDRPSSALAWLRRYKLEPSAFYVPRTLYADVARAALAAPEPQAAEPDNKAPTTRLTVNASELAALLNEAAAALRAAPSPPQMGDIVLAEMLADLFGWSDRSYLHAIMHVENAVKNLRADAAALRAAQAAPADRGTTHYEGCWRTRGHHECAIAEVERLQAAQNTPAKASGGLLERDGGAGTHGKVSEPSAGRQGDAGGS
jgi:hypothetical protein